MELYQVVDPLNGVTHIVKGYIISRRNPSSDYSDCECIHIIYIYIYVYIDSGIVSRATFLLTRDWLTQIRQKIQSAKVGKY